MANAELTASDDGRIVIPMVYCNGHLAGWRPLSVSGWAESLIGALGEARYMVAAADWSTVETAYRGLERCNAFPTTSERDVGERRRGRRAAELVLRLVCV